MSKKTHGMSKTRTYKSWSQAIQRCHNENSPDYPNWGGRGICVCPRWRGADGFVNFFEDMGERPEKMTLDRIMEDGDYKKDNCRWATKQEQNANRRGWAKGLNTKKGFGRGFGGGWK